MNPESHFIFFSDPTFRPNRAELAILSFPGRKRKPAREM